MSVSQLQGFCRQQPWLKRDSRWRHFHLLRSCVTPAFCNYSVGSRTESWQCRPTSLFSKPAPAAGNNR
ncbi:hypothetical protein KCP73_12440 [Salmonella enterica subsp. enterica]|nr:hypothetical protein KCP73_12440 [Salmonella enterica subsp. enterica]